MPMAQKFRRCLFTYVLALLSSGFVVHGEAQALSVVNAEPRPNYFLATDEDDLRQLTDGVVVPYPSWTKRNSVGWKLGGAVRLQVDFPENARRACSEGNLRFSSSQKKSAGIVPPRRIDVYGVDDSGRHHFLAGANYAASDFPDKTSVLLKLPVQIRFPQLVIVLHSGGQFLMLDEIEWIDSGSCGTSDVGSRSTAHLIVADPVQDSRRRLIEFFENPAAESLRSLPFRTWVADPWRALSNSGGGALDQERAVARKPLRLLAGEQLAMVVGLQGGCKSSGASWRVNWQASKGLSERLHIARLQKVVASDGTHVHDAIVPLLAPGLPCSVERSEYLWVEADSREMKPGRYVFSLELSAPSGEVSVLNETIEILENTINPECLPKALAWGYRQDLPVWNNPGANLRDLVDHGVNVFVIHPGSLAPTQASLRLAGEVKEILEASPKAQILLYLALDKWVELQRGGDSSEKAARLNAWIKQLMGVLNNAGVPYSQWALYPIDEPSGKQLPLLDWVIEQVGAIEPRVRIYANPVSSSRHPVSALEIVNLAKKVQILQPSYDLAVRTSRSLNSLGIDWWVYENPPYPAKTTEPFFYKTLGQKAWAMGAKGVGFWSYSDTTSSSAWNDFDGKRADWAVVYEGAAGPVSSRRWQAFRSGLIDYSILCSLEKGSPETKKNFDALRSSVFVSRKGVADSGKLLERFKDGF